MLLAMVALAGAMILYLPPARLVLSRIEEAVLLRTASLTTRNRA